MTAKFRLQWGILGPGEIARAFGKDCLLDPETRDVYDIEHTVVAAASSSSQQRAQTYLEDINAPRTAKAYGSYDQIVHDPEVDVIYVATPHSHHFQHSMLCLEAGKNVLCEKPISVNSNQLRKLITTAESKDLFLMEAAWTRYMPASRYVQDAIQSGVIGRVHRVFADLSNCTPPGTIPDTHRLLSPDLAGGVLLDIGIYALTWAFMALYKSNDEDMHGSSMEPILVSSAVEKHRTGVDAQTSMMLLFPQDSLHTAHGFVTTSMLVSTDPADQRTVPSVRIQGSKGEIQVFHPIFRPENTRIIHLDGTIEDKAWRQPGLGKGSGWYNGFQNEFGGSFHAEGEGHGMFWEADECAFALRDGRKESRVHNLQESLVLTGIIDQVRAEHGIKFADAVETVSYLDI